MWDGVYPPHPKGERGTNVREDSTALKIGGTFSLSLSGEGPG